MDDEQFQHPGFVTMPTPHGSFVRFRASSIYATGPAETAGDCYIFAGPGDEGWKVCLTPQQAEARIAAAEGVQAHKVSMSQVTKAAQAVWDESKLSWRNPLEWENAGKLERKGWIRQQIAAFRAAGFEVEDANE